MNVLYTAYYMILRTIRNWMYLVTLIVAPIIVISITGLATDHIDKVRMIEKVKVVYYSEDSGKVSEAFEKFIEDKKVTEAFQFEKASSYDDGLKKVKDAKTEAYIYIDSDFTKKLQEGSKPDIKIFGGKKDSSVKSLVESFVNVMNTQVTVQSMGKIQTNEISYSNNVNETGLSPAGISPSGLDRWTYFNILLFMFYGAIVSSFAVINDVTKNTIVRINSAPIGSVSDIAGKILGNTVTFFICSLIVVVFTKFAYGSNWSGNMGITLLVLLIYCLFVTCVGIIIGKVIKRMAVAVLLVICSNALLFNLANLGDVKWGRNSDTATFSIISPHYYTAKALINNIFNGPNDSVYYPMLYLAGITMIMLIISLILGRRTAQ